MERTGEGREFFCSLKLPYLNQERAFSTILSLIEVP